MKKVTLLSSLLVAGALTFTGLDNNAEADEIEFDAAKTVWGTLQPAESDIDGDGWSDGGYDFDWLPEAQQDKVEQLADQQVAGEITQVEYNEAVSDIFDEEHALLNGPYGGFAVNDNENLASYAFNAPKTLDAAPLKDGAYHYNFIYDGYEFDFKSNGEEWTWSYDEAQNEYTDEELIDLVHNNPEVLDEKPVKSGAYDFKIEDDKYVYHFASDGEQWTWSYESK